MIRFIRPYCLCRAGEIGELVTNRIAVIYNLNDPWLITIFYKWSAYFLQEKSFYKYCVIGNSDQWFYDTINLVDCLLSISHPKWSKWPKLSNGLGLTNNQLMISYSKHHNCGASKMYSNTSCMPCILQQHSESNIIT